MSENQTPETPVITGVKPRELTEKDYRELLKKATPTERRLILELEEYMRYNHDVWRGYKILYGEATQVVLEERWDDYGTSRVVALIPRMVPVIVLYKSVDEFRPEENYRVIYVFDGDGWKEVELR